MSFVPYVTMLIGVTSYGTLGHVPLEFQQHFFSSLYNFGSHKL